MIQTRRLTSKFLKLLFLATGTYYEVVCTLGKSWILKIAKMHRLCLTCLCSIVQPLRSAFRRMGIPPTFVPDHLDGSLSYTVQNYLKKVKQQGKIEAERLVNLVGKSSTRDSNNRPILRYETLDHLQQLNHC